MNTCVTKDDAITGLYCGVAGGTVFAIVIGVFYNTIGAAGSMLPMIAGLVRSEAALVGFVINLIISVLVAIGFVTFFKKHIHTTLDGAIYGLSYGFIWWILGPFILMPLLMGMPIELSNQAAAMRLPSLWAHIVFGLVVGLTYATMFKKHPSV